MTLSDCMYKYNPFIVYYDLIFFFFFKLFFHIAAFPSSKVFDVIQEAISADNTLKKKVIRQSGAIVVFTLKNKEGKTESWYLDLKKEGGVGKGSSAPAGPADITLNLSESDFGALIEGKANAQRLFMSGKLKVKGNVMKAASIESVLKTAQQKKSKL